MSYTDPENVTELLAEFKSLSNKDDIHDFITRVFPGWLIASADRYSVDYPHLQHNWETICRKTQTQPQKIVIVDTIFFDKKEDKFTHSLLTTICEVLTRYGYVVRRKEEITGCLECQSAMPTEELWGFMKQAELPVPQVWSRVCSRCCSNVEEKKE